MIPFTPDERRAQFAPSQNVGGPVDPDILDIIGERPQPTMAQQVEYEVPEPRPIDPDVMDIVNKGQGPMMASLMGASRVNPDQAAEAKRLGSQIGIGQDIALRNLEDVRKRAFMADVQRRDIARANPVLAGFLSDPTFANEASDDIEPLSKFERAMDYIANIGQAAIDIPGEFGAGFRTGQVLVEAGMLGSTAQLRGLATEDEIQKWNQYQAELQTLSGDVGFWRQTGETLGQLTRAGEEAVKGGVAGGVTGAGAALLAGQLGPQVFLPEEIVTVPAATLFGVGAGITSAFATTSARTMAGNNYMKNIQSGMDPDVARVTALGVGAIGGALELFGAKLVAAPFKGLWSKVVSDAANDALVQPTVAKAIANAGLQYSKAVGGEIGTEVGQQITEIAFDEIAGYASDPNFESRFATPEGRIGIRDELKDIIVRTALGISVLGGIGPGANLYVDLRRASKATKQTQFFNDLVQTSAESKLKARDAGAYERFVAATADGTGADTIFVDGATMRTVLSQAEVTDAQLEAIVPGLAQQVRQAAEQGNDVTIPTAQFAARLAGTKLGDGLLPHMRLSPDAMSAMEAQQFEQNREALVEEARVLLESKTESESAFVQEADQVATTMRERLIAAGRDPALAEVESLVHQAFVVTQAARQGKTPAQFEDESGLREIVGAEMPAAPLEQANQFDQAGQRRTDTPEFKAWSNNAPIVQGEATEFATRQPFVGKAYHGSPVTDITEFDPFAPSRFRKELERGMGAIWFGAEPATATNFAGMAGSVYPVYVTLQNPLVVDASKEAQPDLYVRLQGGQTIYDIQYIKAAAIARAKREGHDGVVFVNAYDGSPVGGKATIYAIFNPTDIKSVSNRGTWSRTTANIMEQASRIDADYMAAVERGDMETAQRMVDEAARSVGLTELVWRGDRAGAAITQYRRGARREPGIFTTTTQEIADKYAGGVGLARQFYVGGRTLDLTTPTAETVQWIRQWAADAEWDFVDRTTGEQIAPEDAVMSGLLFDWEGTMSGARWKDIQATAAEQGYDIVKLIDMDEQPFVSTVVLNENRIKSADAITRDEAGNVVPLSQRFDITSPRIFEQAQVPEELDAEYMTAVDSGDTATAQRIVDSAAEQRMPNSVVRDDAGKLLRIYHGTQRIDRVGNRLLKKRATSGPMPFFTNTKAIAEGYAQGKQDTSIEDIGYEQWVKYKPKGQRSMVTLDQAWAYLTPEQRTTATERLFTVGYQNPDEGTGPIVTDTKTIASRDHVQYLLREARGNALTAAKELWLNSGSLFNDEQQFMDVLKGMGLTEGFVYDSPHAVNSGVIEAYVNITNPLDTAAIPESVVGALQQRANRIRKPAAQYGRDHWDKELRDPQSWMETLRTDIAEGETTAWTSIPDWVTDVLRGLGYDGIKDTGGKFGGEQHTVWIPFEPEQVKFANTITKDGSGKIVPVLERFDITSPMMFRQAAVPAAFYSALGRAIDGIDIKSASASGWKERIKGLVNKGDIKQDELTWSGLEDWLSLPREGKITKEEVAAFLKNNGVRVERVTTGAPPANIDELRNALERAEMAHEEALERQTAADRGDDEAAVVAATEAANQTRRAAVQAKMALDDAERPLPTKYAQYTLPGGTNYREMLLTLPAKTPAILVSQNLSSPGAGEMYELTFENISQGAGLSGTVFEQNDGSWRASFRNDFTVRESRDSAVAWVKNEMTQLAPALKSRVGYKSSHWEHQNIVAHLRMNDRVDADGKRVLFVEEIQSDWAQAGRKKGFGAIPIAPFVARQQFAVFKDGKEVTRKNKEGKEVKQRYTSMKAAEAAAAKVGGEARDIGMQADTEGWVNLALKQIMLEAVNGGYDRVAFINGEQSKDRYDLAKQVRLVSVNKQADGRYLTYIEGIDGTALIRNRDGFSDAGQKAMTAEELEATVGKEVATQAIEGKPNKEGWVDVRGDNLRVGGEGMVAFYDKIVPAATSKLLEKLDGGKLGEVRLPYMLPKQMEADADRLGMTQADILEVAGEEDAYAQNQAGFNITDTLREKIASGLPLFQAMPGRGPARGGYDPSRLKILFGKGADFTTGAHELTHYYVDYYTKQAIAGTAAPQMLADLDIMFKFMGVDGATPEERLAAFNAMPFETSRPLIETITYNAEIYLFEGKAPSLELAGVFDRMLAFFRRAYKSIADFVTQQREIYRREFGRELPELSDELRQVFDRMLADERQIKQAQAVAQMRGQFTIKPEGMDDAEWAAYQEMAGEATNAAIADMTKASLRQMEWLSRARSRIIKDMQARHTAQRKEVRERVQREVQQDPLYRAMAFLRRGQVVAPDGTVTEAEGVHRIDRVLAAEFAPTVDLTRLGGRFGVLQDDGLHPDIVAEMFGYPAGATLLQALADAKPMREVVEDRTDAEMLRLYGEMNTPAAREQEIQKALHNEARARLVGVELRFMGKIQQPVRVLLEAARQAAQQAIGRRRIVEIRPSEFVAAEAKASREVTAAMQENKPDVAVRAKRAQLLNNQLAKAALEARDEIDNGVRYLRRVLRDSNRQRMGADVADQIARLLRLFNIAPMPADAARSVETLTDFLATLEDRGVVPDIAEAIEKRDEPIPYKNMTVTDFRDLVDAVKQLEYIGKNERKILLAKEKAEFESVRDQIVASVIENAGDRKDNARTATTNIGRAVTAMKGFAAAHLKAASIVRILDGGKDGGPLWNYLIRSANEAGDSETSMRAEATADLTKILEPVFRAGKLGGKGMFFPTIDRAMNREARLVVALNMGNAGNMQRLLDGEGWSIESVMPVLQSLTEDELNTVQQIWDYFEKYRPMIGQKERRLYGKEPAWVDPQPLVVRSADGKTVTLRGGYYPIKYDPRASMRAETMSAAEEAKRDLGGAYTTATTRRSFTKARVRKVDDRPLLYTLAGMYGGINDVIHDLTWHEWLIQANRLMRSNSFDAAVRNRYGPEYLAQLKNWIKDVAAGERGVQNEAEMALNFLRQGISSAGLGFNIVSAIMQITGFNQSIVRVGAKWIGRGIAYTVTNPMLAMQEVNEKSEFMRNRSRTQFRELNEIRNMVQGQSIAMRRVQMGTYFLMMRMQRMVDVPTWHGAYEKAMHEGRDEETAIALADQAVIDSQGGGMVKDLARVERGGPAVKLFTVFYGYMNTVYNMAAVQTMTNKNKGRLAADYAMLFVVPVVLSYMLKQALIPRKGDEEEEWDMGKIGRELAAEQLSYLMGTMVIAREFGEVGKMIFGVEGPRMGYGGPAGLRAIGETYQFATQASQGEFDRAFRKSAVNMIGAFTGLPSAQVNRTLDGLEALYEGETENVLAPLTGAKKR